MKFRYCALSIALVFSLVLCLSCGQEYGILDYQNGDIFANCDVNGKWNVNIIKEGNIRSLEVISPSEMAGVLFTFDTDCTVKYDGLEVRMPNDKVRGIFTLCSIFDLDEGWVGAVSSDTLDTVSFNSENICYTVTYNSVSLPERVIISGEFDFDITIKSLELKQK